MALSAIELFARDFYPLRFVWELMLPRPSGRGATLGLLPRTCCMSLARLLEAMFKFTSIASIIVKFSLFGLNFRDLSFPLWLWCLTKLRCEGRFRPFAVLIDSITPVMGKYVQGMQIWASYVIVSFPLLNTPSLSISVVTLLSKSWCRVVWIALSVNQQQVAVAPMSPRYSWRETMSVQYQRVRGHSSEAWVTSDAKICNLGSHLSYHSLTCDLSRISVFPEVSLITPSCSLISLTIPPKNSLCNLEVDEWWRYILSIC